MTDRTGCLSVGTVGVPFEPQQNGPGRRCCAAAALTMVYRSFGRPADSDMIAAELADVAPGIQGTRTFHLARHALFRGLTAIPCRLRDPFGFLRLVGTDIRVVLNHRICPDSPLGHFTLFLGLDPDKETVRIHDPQFGPDRILEKEVLLELWTPMGENDEITGNVAILFAEKQEAENRTCPRCGSLFGTKPFESMGANPFLVVFCPSCDRAQDGRFKAGVQDAG